MKITCCWMYAIEQEFMASKQFLEDHARRWDL
jgi:hypothetical protein